MCALQKKDRRHRVAVHTTVGGLALTNKQGLPLDPPDIISQADIQALASELLMHSEDEDAAPVANGSDPTKTGALLTRTCDWRTVRATRALHQLEGVVPQGKRSYYQRGSGAVGEITAVQIRALLNNTALHWALDIAWLSTRLAELTPAASRPVTVSSTVVVPAVATRSTFEGPQVSCSKQKERER